MREASDGVGRRFPPWLKKRLQAGGEVERVRAVLTRLHLATVCQSARCPNQHECFHRGTATFMILGDSCTRACRFCAVTHEGGRPLDPDEPRHVAEAVRLLGLRHVVITSVTRDDLPDGGAAHFAQTIAAVRGAGDVTVEVLTPDFRGCEKAIDRVASAGPRVYNHNVETVPRLYGEVRPEADYAQSLRLLERVATRFPEVAAKSGLMVGLGETLDEVRAVMQDLRAVGCRMLTIGQYLRPSPAQLPVARFVMPEEFAALRGAGMAMGFAAVAAGPFVRSSYHAEALLASQRT